MNQPAAAEGKHTVHEGRGQTVANRIWAVTYFLEVPAVATGQPPRLMRQVNGQTPQPVADNIINLKSRMTCATAQMVQLLECPQRADRAVLPDTDS